jgi:hypothetical protein
MRGDDRRQNAKDAVARRRKLSRKQRSRKKRRARCATPAKLKNLFECGLFAELGDLVREP